MEGFRRILLPNQVVTAPSFIEAVRKRSASMNEGVTNSTMNGLSNSRVRLL